MFHIPWLLNILWNHLEWVPMRTNEVFIYLAANIYLKWWNALQNNHFTHKIQIKFHKSKQFHDVFSFNDKYFNRVEITLRKINQGMLQNVSIKHLHIWELPLFSAGGCSWNKLGWITITCISLLSVMWNIFHNPVLLIIYNKCSLICLIARLIVWLSYCQYLE